jgi:iron complex transport system substrate-binding protein
VNTSRLVFVSAALLSSALAACGDDDDDGAAATTEAAAWTFVDDRGTEITLDAPPERIVAYENAAGALIPLGITPVGVFGSSVPADSPQLEGLDVTGVESVGSVYGEVNFEAVAELEPDLIVTLYDPEQTGPAFGFLDNGEELAEAIAPVLVIDGGSKADAEPTIERFIELAEAMGGDLDDAAIDASRQRFDDAVAALRSTVEANPGVEVVAMAPYAGDLVYFARPQHFASLRLFRDAGVELAEPEGDPGDQTTDFAQYFYDPVSFELAGKYPADLYLLGNNVGVMGADDVAADPAFAQLPAVEAGRFVEWRMIDAYSYDRFAGDVEALTAAIAAADASLVP